jgi:hypothetical protein
MPRIPGYGKKQPKSVTTDMTWDAPEKAEKARVEQEERQKRIIYRVDPEEEAKQRRDAIKREHIRTVQAERNKYRCSFCGNEDREHECLEYKSELKKYSDSTNRTMRPGIPWTWIVEHYGKRGKIPPLPQEMYEKG